jgi:hypothetical protein
LDGKRFLMIKPGPSDQINQGPGAAFTPVRPTQESFVIVQNWPEELRRLVPTR